MGLERLLALTTGTAALGTHLFNIGVGVYHGQLQANGIESGFSTLPAQMIGTVMANALWFNTSDFFSGDHKMALYENTKNGISFGIIATTVEYSAGRIIGYGASWLLDKF